MFLTPDLESQEAHTGEVVLEDQVDIVKMMLSYFYTQDYDDHFPSFEIHSVNDPGTGRAFEEMNTLDETKADEVLLMKVVDEFEVEKVRMTNNIRVYAIADKYNILGLKELAKTKFETLVTPSDRLILDCPSAICEIYDTTPSEDRGLRDIVKDVCARHLQEIIHSNYWSLAARTRVDFTFDLLCASAARLQLTEKLYDDELTAKRAEQITKRRVKISTTSLF